MRYGPRGRADPAAVLALGSGVAVACREAAGAGVIAAAENQDIWAPVPSACESGVPGGREREIGPCWRTDG